MSVILRTASRFLMPLFLVFSVFLLLRGHDEPGGGFTGGLVAAAAFALHAVAAGPAAARRALGVHPRAFIPLGLAIAAGSALPALLRGQPLMTAQWVTLTLPNGEAWHVGTPLGFDAGVYLVVFGVVLTIILTLAAEDEPAPPESDTAAAPPPGHGSQGA
jgi:multicomponent Na+:H+ antiporter subunit B